VAGKSLLVAGCAVANVLFADASTEFISVNWQNFTALVVLSITLLFLVTKYLPDIVKANATALTTQAQHFAEAARLQTEASVKATSTASIEATKAMATMHGCFTATLDKMHERYHADNTAIVDAIGAMAQHCAATNGAATIHALRKQREESGK
jgi:hypothetical protein